MTITPEQIKMLTALFQRWYVTAMSAADESSARYGIAILDSLEEVK
jgi:hypothetical protein